MAGVFHGWRSFYDRVWIIQIYFESLAFNRCSGRFLHNLSQSIFSAAFTHQERSDAHVFFDGRCKTSDTYRCKKLSGGWRVSPAESNCFDRMSDREVTTCESNRRSDHITPSAVEKFPNDGDNKDEWFVRPLFIPKDAILAICRRPLVLRSFRSKKVDGTWCQLIANQISFAESNEFVNGSL